MKPSGSLWLFGQSYHAAYCASRGESRHAAASGRSRPPYAAICGRNKGGPLGDLSVVVARRPNRLRQLHRALPHLVVVASHAVASSVSQRRRQPPLSRSSSPVGREEGHNVVPMVEAADSLPAGNARQQQTSALGRPRTAALGSCGRAPHHIAVRSSPVRANGGTVAPSTRRTTALARFEIGGDWASVGLVGCLAWWAASSGPAPRA